MWVVVYKEKTFIIIINNQMPLRIVFTKLSVYDTREKKK